MTVIYSVTCSKKKKECGKEFQVGMLVVHMLQVMIYLCGLQTRMLISIYIYIFVLFADDGT